MSASGIAPRQETAGSLSKKYDKQAVADRIGEQQFLEKSLALSGHRLATLQGSIALINLAHSFADRVVNVAVTGTLVRIEFGVLNRPESKDHPLQLEANQVLVMPLEGFVNSFGMLEALMKKLVEDGVLRPRTENTGGSTSSDSQASPARK